MKQTTKANSMKKIPTLARKWFRRTGRTMIILSFAIPVHAEPSTPMPSESSVQKTEKRQTVTDEQRDMALRILATAMAIMRDDQPFDPAHTIFGRNFAVNLRRGSMSTEYSFENPAFPRAYITLSVVADPTDYTADRRKVKRVPTEFTVWFSPLMKGITRSMLEDLFPLDIGYWVDGNGNRRPGNDMGAIPPQVLLHHYRYRASNQPASRFPVDVQLAFGDPDPQATDGDAPKTPVLLGVLLTRDYSELIPKQR